MNGSIFSLVFGPFQVAFPQRTLLRDSQVIRLGSRATDILVALLEANGELVSRDALIARVWPNTIVDEGALRVHMSSVRKVLNDGADSVQYISNEPGRGYRFIAPISRMTIAPISNAQRRALPTHNLPGQITHILGRSDVIDRLMTQLVEKRCLTIAGPGGIGKTTVALAIAHRFLEESCRPVCFVDLAPLSEAGAVISAVASALGVPLSKHDALHEIIDALGSEPRLLLIDNCEHLIEPVAALVERLLQDAPTVNLLITSREPLRAEGEWIHRLASLPAPAPGGQVSVDEALSFPAIRLFIDRATAVRHDFTLSEQNVSAVCDICRRLDGIPLAIEFAAARADWLDAQSIADHLDTRFKLLTKGRRTALPRQQTLRATLDWSYDLLDPCAQAVLRRISLFRNAFDLEAMNALAACPTFDESAIFDTASDLIAKSLLTSEQVNGETFYRLLDTTRYYGVEQLENAGESRAFKRRHAQYCKSLFKETQEAWDGNAQLERRARHSRRIDDVRCALDWAFSEEGDVALGIDLVVVSSFLWFHLSIANEFFAYAERALKAIDQTELAGTALHVDLLTSYGQSRWHTFGPEQGMSDAFERALALANTLDEEPLKMRAVWGLWMHRLITGRYVESLQRANEFHVMALRSGHTGSMSTGNNMIALSVHFHGDVDSAVELIERVIADDSTAERLTHANAAQVDGYLSAHAHLMLFMWLQGGVDKALDIARAAAEESLVLDHDLTICAVLTTGAIPVAIGSGDLILAASMTALTRERAQRRGMRYWDQWGAGFEAVLNGQPIDLSEATLMQLETFAALGLDAALDQLEAREHHRQQGWAQPELLRQHALRLSDPLGDLAVEELELSLDLARRQSARTWQLRSALTLARVRVARGEGQLARETLARILGCFNSTSSNTDVMAARHFLAEPSD